MVKITKEMSFWLALIAFFILVEFFIFPKIHDYYWNDDSKSLKKGFLNKSKLAVGNRQNVPVALWSEIDTGKGSKSNSFPGLGYTSHGKNLEYPEKSVVYYDSNKSWEGLNLYSSSHAPKAFLTNMKGDTLHTWQYEWKEAFPGKNPVKQAIGPTTKIVQDVKKFKRAAAQAFADRVITKDGGLVAIYNGLGIIKINKNSQLEWARQIAVHHDVKIRNGSIYTIRRRPIQSGKNRKKLFDDLIIEIDSKTGKILNQVSILESIRNSDFFHLLKKVSGADLFHANNLELIQRKDLPAPFKQGNILVSSPTLHTLLLIDMSTKKVKWTLSGPFYSQHDPDILSNGNILVFDNGLKSSRVLELDPFSEDIVWKYAGDPKQDFFTRVVGSNQRLTNGNTVINETMDGRVIEVTPSGEIVWEFFNPHRAGKNDQYIGLIDLERISKESVRNWLKLD